ncbi:hypothetical protein NAL32_19740 [Chryseobacterium sp. Ch-15]|uniref:Uncharacterized protein n=1 Tax=Chryseobacterium muglaense TaxID=2893752 RepID=A0A9Q3V0V4_9FLAO|nr:hypothetical protein [Chryseobacterium muglaense]MBD3906396.1 hypothetical protein [Chryseobacterium muglaense]MCC9037081.1 hypothetical protein [Chryseobacterium muglaense]MCM2556628.1 hypothetical protein [Chryseobacterium muglaense]
MKKLLFASALCLASFSFANTSKTETVTESQNLKEETLKSDLATKKSALRTYYTIEFDIDCGNGTGGHMTVSFPSENWGWAFIADLGNAISSGTEEGCKKIAEMGL